MYSLHYYYFVLILEWFVFEFEKFYYEKRILYLKLWNLSFRTFIKQIEVIEWLRRMIGTVTSNKNLTGLIRKGCKMGDILFEEIVSVIQFW